MPLRAIGRSSMWPEDNEWLREFFGVIARVVPMAPPPADAPGPFSLGDPERVRGLLHAAGWADVGFAAADELLWFGPDPNSETTFMVGQMKWLFHKLDDVGSNPVGVPRERALTCADVDQRRPCGRGERTASAGR